MTRAEKPLVYPLNGGLLPSSTPSLTNTESPEDEIHISEKNEIDILPQI